MRRFVSSLSLAVAVAAAVPAAELLRPPDTRRAPVTDVLHGIEISDPYRWLEDQDAPETRAWIEAQNAYTQKVLGAASARDAIHARLTALHATDVVTPPLVRAGRYFFTKRSTTQDIPVLYMRKGLRAPDEVLVDPHGLSADRSVTAQILSVTPDGRTFAYGLRTGGEDEVVVRFLDVERREHLADSLPRARYAGVAVSPDHRQVYYARLTAAGPRVFVHTLGRDTKDDQEIFGAGYGPEKIITTRLSDDGRYLIVIVLHGSSARKTEVYVQDLKDGTPLTAIVNDIDAAFGADLAGGRVFMRTNWKAPNYRVLAVDLAKPGREHWREVIPEGKGVLTQFSAAGGRLFAVHLEDVQSRLRVYTPEGGFVRDVALPAIGTVGGVEGTWAGDEVFFQFSSFVQPAVIYRHAATTGTQEVWARLEVPVRTDDFVLEQVWFTSRDGTRVPMFVAHKRGLKLDGSHPALLTGYGGFNTSLTPAFSQQAAFWVESGGVYAVPNLRGGGEFGEAWHEAGMLARKQNVFDDFIAAAEWLVAKKYTSPRRLAISGRSNGGLLVGAALTQRPDLFQAVICGYPLLDMVRYHKFLVAGYWVPEYGSAESPEQLKYLMAYSPYHRVQPGVKYPAVLFVTGDADTRVAPLHARKMAALLQAASASDRPVLLRYDTKAGHTSAQPVGQRVLDSTAEMSFLFQQLGMGAPTAVSSRH